MKPDVHVDNNANMYGQNRLLKFVIVTLGIAVVISSVLSYQALKYQKIVILPPVIDKKMEITGKSVDEEYIRQFTRYIMGLLLTYSPPTVKGQYDEILLHTYPGSYTKFKQKLEDTMADIEKLSVSSAFYMQSVKVDTASHTIDIGGIKRQYSQDHRVYDGKANYRITYTVVDGRFYVVDFQEI